MKTSPTPLKKVAATIVATSALVFSAPSYALFGGAANIATESTQIVSWGLQYAQMIEQYNKLVAQLTQLHQTYTSLNGVRNMGDLVNNPITRKYLPADYQTILNNGYGNWQQIQAASKIFDRNQSALGAASDIGKLFDGVSKQVAINRATYEDAYKRASARFDDIQVLLDKVNQAPDSKDMADLQGRIQAEQVMMQNEQIKLAMLTSLSQAQEKIAAQQAVEIRMKATRSGEVSRF